MTFERLTCLKKSAKTSDFRKKFISKTKKAHPRSKFVITACNVVNYLSCVNPMNGTDMSRIER